MDSWDNEKMFVLVDGNQWETTWQVNTGGQRICANTWPDGFFDVTMEFPHDQG
jgi:hypothetical protein